MQLSEGMSTFNCGFPSFSDSHSFACLDYPVLLCLYSPRICPVHVASSLLSFVSDVEVTSAGDTDVIVAFISDKVQ